MRARVEQQVHEPGGGLQKVLTVVQNEEQLPATQDLCERLG
jgi:hypothetical protein